MKAGARSELRWTEIDGLRGCLSIIVVVGHLASVLGVWTFASMQRWYWMPMDIFFVMSGFLLGRIVVLNIARPSFLRAYFTRRVLRIWPAYYTVTLTVSLFYLAFSADGAPWSWLSFVKQLAFLQFTEHLVLAPRGDYLFPLVHTWSVAVEEHFYILLPLLVAGLAAIRNRIGIIGALLVIAALSVYLRLFKGMDAWVFATRLHSFAVGLLAGYLTIWAEDGQVWSRLLRSRVLLAALGVVALLWAFAAPLLPYENLGALSPTNLRWVSQSLAAAALGGFLLMAIYQTNLDGGRGIRLLRNPVLVHLGEISYSTYLWHGPIFVALRAAGLQVQYAEFGRSVIAIAIVLVVANLSYYFIERPFLRLKKRNSYHEPKAVAANGVPAQPAAS